MSATPSERWLFGATVGSALLVVASHGGVPISCASRPLRADSVMDAPIDPAHLPTLELVSESRSPHRATISRGTVIRVHQSDPGYALEAEGALAGVDPTGQTLVVVRKDGVRVGLPLASIQSVAVMMEDTSAGTGALVGGLSGLAVGVGVGLGTAPTSGYAPLCAVVGGGSVGLLGTGVGAGIGAAARSRGVMEKYVVGPYDWQFAVAKGTGR